jgi:UV DNA damage endonuclease
VKLGFAVKVLGDGGLPSHDARRWQSNPHLRVSLGHLDAILDYLERVDIGMYRVATALAPYASHPDMPRFRHQVDDCLEELSAVGAKARSVGVRVSSHPGQYTVLNSEKNGTVRAALDEIEVQAELFEAMAMPPETVVVLHVGGGAGGEEAALERFEKGFARLSERAQSRLVIENDDHSFDIVSCAELARRIGRPVVWDVLHHRCHNPRRVGDGEALDMALGTWSRRVTPKVHFSSPRLDIQERNTKRGGKNEKRLVLPPLKAHADLIDPSAFEHFLELLGGRRDVDIMLEAKGKDLALLRLRDQMRARNLVVS